MKSNQPKTRINLDLPNVMLAEIDAIAERIGIARQALIKMWIHEMTKRDRD